MARAADHIGSHVKEGIQTDGGDVWFHVDPPAGAWLPRFGAFEAYCEVLLGADDDW